MNGGAGECLSPPMSWSRDLRQRQADFERQAMPHSSSLLRAARRLTFDAALAEDLTQEALLRAWRAFDQFETGSNIRAWLFRILFNAYYAHGRALGARPVLVPMLAVPGLANVVSPGSTNFREQMDVASAFDTLRQEHREVLALIVIEGFTCREAGEILNVPIGTVMSRLSRARQALREQLGARPARRDQPDSLAMATRQTS
jgi:RNA polymerase sigma-70 factor, ECF subfamily